MKTALTELIETHIDGCINALKDDKVVAVLKLIRADAIRLLEKEQQQILSAYDAGKEQPSNSQQCPIDYYDQNFK